MKDFQLALEAKNVVRCVKSDSLWATATKQKNGVKNEFWYFI